MTNNRDANPLNGLRGRPEEAVSLPWLGATQRILEQEQLLEKEALIANEVNEASTGNDVRCLLLRVFRMLRRAQIQLGPSQRLHLLWESQNDDGNPEVLVPSRVQLRTAFSPTISLETPARRTAARQLADSLSTFTLLCAFQTSETGTGLSPNNHTPQMSRLVAVNLREPGTSFVFDPSAPELAFPGSIRVIAPSWFPGKGVKKSDFPSTESVTISSSVLRKFDHLPREQIHWLYRLVFRMMHKRLKESMRDLPRTLSYNIFTPPWLRMKIKCGDGTHIMLDDLSVPDLRHQKSTYGRKRIFLYSQRSMNSNESFPVNLWIGFRITKTDCSNSRKYV